MTYRINTFAVFVALIGALMWLPAAEAEPMTAEQIKENGDPEAGKALFEAKCNSCHVLGQAGAYPNLKGVTGRWEGREALLYKFIKNAAGVIKSGDDEYVNNLWAEYQPTMMTTFATLKDEQITNVLAYIQAWEPPVPANGGDGGSMAAANTFLGMTPGMAKNVLWGAIVVLLLALFAIFRAQAVIGKMQYERDNGAPKPPSGFDKTLMAVRPYMPLVATLAIVVAVLGGVTNIVVNRAFDVGNQIDYAPEQPIKFSHALHAGQYEIDCKYCHTGVEKSKSANIPSVNICMNCHTGIEGGSKSGEKGKAQVKLVRQAYNDSLPIEWTRIHNLPDHVYFNHQQHVVAGQIECQACHGQIQEMEVVAQHSTIQMGWCINCHRSDTANIWGSGGQVDSAVYIDMTNPYYQETYKYSLQGKQHSISEIGGLECAKCHY